MTSRTSPFFSTFRGILATSGVLAAPACSWSSCPSGPADVLTHVSTEVVDYDGLETALEDGITVAECASLCQETFDDVEGCSLSYDEDEYARIQAEREALAGGGGAGGVGGAESVPNTTLSIECEVQGFYYCEGRRHVTWGRRTGLPGCDPLAQWLARAAANEAGSVRSFRSLALELGRAKRGKIWARRLRQAARDEIRHARTLERLAQGRGIRRPKQEFRATEERSLLRLALENAREGCVGETWAGLVALHQAHTARDPAIRAAFEAIARDEATHADLAWDLHQWLMTELAPPEREQLARALDSQIAQLESVGWALASAELSEPARRALGLPAPLLEERLRCELARQLQTRRVAA
jgi:rubrerythrin